MKSNKRPTARQQAETFIYDPDTELAIKKIAAVIEENKILRKKIARCRRTRNR